MRLATVPQAQQIDEISQSVYGLSSEILMESAGALAAREIDLSFLPELTRGRVVVVCGPGHNGGDGLVVARHLHSAGHRDLQIFMAGPERARTALCKLQLKRCELQGLRIIDLAQVHERLEQIKSAELIVDAVFGIGLTRPVQEPYLAVIEAMNSARAPKVAIDVPSGLNADTGRIEGGAMNAAMTITFGLSKPGLFISEGASHCGRLRVLPIGFPYEALRGVATTHFLFNERLARRYLPKRREVSNKSDYGRTLVLAGRPGFWGAGILASSAAFRMGSGYVTWASFEAPYEALKEVPEVLTGQVADAKLWESSFTSAAIGPGIGVGEPTAKLIERLRGLNIPVVVDADAITTCVEHGLFPLPKDWILTPHSGELSRILKVHTQDIEKDRFAAAFEAHRKTGCHVLLKGFRSIIAYGSRALIVHAGNSGLAKAGTGDVLTGMISGLLAQGLDTPVAAATAAYLHGRLADDWLRSGNDKSTLLASDLTALLPQVMSRLRLSGTLF